jgi:FecR protein
MKIKGSLTMSMVLAGLLLSVFLTTGVLAQGPPPPEQQGPPPQDQQGPPSPDQQGQPAQDPPSRVARLSYSVGSVSFQPGGEGDWVQAVNNRPLTTGDNLWADKDSRAELQLGSTSLRIDSETSITFLELDDHTTQVRLSQGSLLFRVRHLDDDDHFEIDTPNSAFVVQRTGEYRVDVNSTGDESDVTVWRGRGEVTGGGASYDVIAGQRARFTGTSELDHQIDQLPGNDDFDSFAFNRDENEDRSESANYISPEVTGYEDLDTYGHWHYEADYGPVWTPVGIAPGWAPYRVGHWAYVEPWGWTWVEDEPWGFAPFHYGRWAFVGGGWCWAPGPIAVRPVFAPALVAFVGGAGFGIGIGVGPAVAWFPLAPREVFVPWYHVSRGYFTNVNVTNTRVNVTQVTNVYNTTVINNRTTITNVTYANQHVTNAVTAVSHDTFANARPVNGNLVKVDEKQIANAPVARSVAVQPSKQSVMGAGRPAAAKPPAAVANRQVVATRTPTAPRQSFEQRQVRTETPGRPEPIENLGRSQEPAANNRPESQPQEASRQAPSRPAVPRPPVTENNRPAAAENSHPYVRTAPPVQENTQRQQSEAQKFNTWQQQRPAPKPQPQRSQPKPEKPRK